MDWTTLLAEVAPIVAALSAILIYGTDRLLALWKWFTARDRRLASIQRMDARISSLLNELRQGAPNSRLHLLEIIPFFAPALILAIGPLIPGESIALNDILGLTVFVIVLLVYALFQTNERIPKLLQQDSENAWKSVCVRYHFLRNSRFAFYSGVIGVLTAVYYSGESPSRLLSVGPATSVALLVYISFLFVSVMSSALVSVENSAFAVRIRKPERSPRCELWRTKQRKVASQKIEGSIYAIGSALEVLRDDGFIEEIDWYEIGSIAIRPEVDHPKM